MALAAAILAVLLGAGTAGAADRAQPARAAADDKPAPPAEPDASAPSHADQEAPPVRHRHRKRRRARMPTDAATAGLGRNCHKKSDCHHKRQTCLKESDMNGKPLALGLCVLPCAVIDEGFQREAGQGLSPTPENVAKTKKRAPPRCPQRYQCRSAGNGVPIDICVRQ